MDAKANIATKGNIEARELEQNEYIICLFCGRAIKQRYDECTPYYECDCVDAQKKRDILEEISRLNRSIPKEKYKIIDKKFLVSC